jgi:outer membrane protein OmpA-like peptidoglycan-associated protein
VVDEFGMWNAEFGQGTFGVTVTAPGYTIFDKEDVVLRPDADETIEVVLSRALVVIEKKRIRITDKVHFEYNRAIVKPDSFELLDEVAHTNIDHEDVGRIEVGGHTDSKGSDSYNLKLSQKRADAVRKYLEEQGVATDRLLSVGYGETKPIDTNRTPDGRDANRRVEFLLIDQEEEEAPEDGEPKPEGAEGAKEGPP